MLARLVGRKAEAASLFLRAAGAAVFVMHGYGKLFGGVDRFSQTVGGIGVPAPYAFALAAAAVEFVGGIFVALGLLTRWAALLQALVMGVAIYYHVRKGDPFVGGWEFPFAMLMTSLALVVVGPGPLSFDRNIIKRDI